jgi:hypothetical protein
MMSVSEADHGFNDDVRWTMPIDVFLSQWIYSDGISRCIIFDDVPPSVRKKNGIIPGG